MCGKLVTVILPAYNEEDNIQRASQTIAAVLEQENINYELLFVNDGAGAFQKILEKSPPFLQDFLRPEATAVR